LEQWIRQRFSLTGAEEIHFPIFDKIFRQHLDVVRQEFRIDPVMDHLTLVKEEDPQLGTCHAIVENYAQKTFGFYLSTHSAKHASAFAEVFARECQDKSVVDPISEAAYTALATALPIGTVLTVKEIQHGKLYNCTEMDKFGVRSSCFLALSEGSDLQQRYIMFDHRYLKRKNPVLFTRLLAMTFTEIAAEQALQRCPYVYLAEVVEETALFCEDMDMHFFFFFEKPAKK